MKSRLAVILLCASLVLLLPVPSAAQWQQTGGPEGCRVNAIAVDGTKAFAAVPGFGVFLSNDNSGKWIAANLGHPSPEDASCLAVGDGILFAGTENERLYYSTDSGAHWNNTKFIFKSPVTALAIVGDDLFIGTYEGLYVCPDYSNNPDIRKLEWVGELCVTSAAAMGTGLIVSDCNETNLSKITNDGKGWSAHKLASPAYRKVNGLMVSGSSLYVSTDKGLFVSSDEGAHWKDIGLALPEGMEISCLAVCGPALLAGLSCYRGPAGILYSTDGGNNWQTAGMGLKKPSIICFGVAGANVFAGTGIGAFLSQDGGMTWEPVNSGLPLASEVGCLLVNGHDLLAGSGDGLHLSPDNGKSWEEAGAGLPLNTGVGALAKSGPNLVAGAKIYSVLPSYPEGGEGAFLSADNGKTWKTVGPGLPPELVVNLAVIGQNLYASSWNNVFMSTDGGSSWKRLTKGLPGEAISCLMPIGQDLFAGLCVYLSGGLVLPKLPVVALFSAIGQNLFASGPPGGGALFYSSDGGSKWKDTGLRFSGTITGVAKIETDLFVGTTQGVYFCKDYASSKEAPKISFSFGGAHRPVRCLLTAGKDLLMGTDMGVLIVRKKGQNWVAAGTGFPWGVPVLCFAITQTDLFAGTSGRGIWRIRLSDLERK